MAGIAQRHAGLENRRRLRDALAVYLHDGAELPRMRDLGPAAGVSWVTAQRAVRELLNEFGFGVRVEARATGGRRLVVVRRS